MVQRLWIVLVILVPLSTLFPQETEGLKAAPVGFRGLELGMDVEVIKEKLTEDLYFNYRGEPDVSFLPHSQDFVIECEGFSFIKRAFFQFFEKKLYIMTVVLDTSRLDHYTLFTRLVDKYGEFTSLSPSKVVWEYESVLLSLERPLSVRYIDTRVFEGIKEAGQEVEDLRSVSRERFLEDF